MKKKKDNLYDLCWLYTFTSDALECFRTKRERIIDFCYTPFYVFSMSAYQKKKILKQGEEALEKIKQRIRALIK